MASIYKLQPQQQQQKTHHKNSFEFSRISAANVLRRGSTPSLPLMLRGSDSFKRVGSFKELV